MSANRRLLGRPSGGPFRHDERDFSRHRLISRVALTACCAFLGIGSTASLRAAECPGGQDWVFTNGTILTMDASDRTASSVRVRNRRIIAVDEAVDRK